MLGYLLPVLLSVIYLYIRHLRLGNAQRRVNLLKSLGVNEVQQKKVVGFLHPYWCVYSVTLG